MTRIVLAPDLKLPIELVTESVAILAVKRAGKSVTAKRLYEQLYAVGVQVGCVDPKGDWWGLRSSADGKRPGLPVLIIGGEHGDVPLDPGSGELVAQLVVRERVSFVLDLSELSKGKVAIFMTAFLETLYRLKAKDENRTPMHLFIDEADAIAPQKPQSGEERMLGAAEDIVRRGGQRGIGITLVTQRAAVLNKNVLTQCGILIMLRTSGSQDIAALDDWIKKHGQPDKRALVMESIATLPRGTAWVWAPAWPDERGIFKKVEIPINETFDSGATPKVGQKRSRPKTVAEVDLDAFRAAMAATIEKAKADDPKFLRARIAELEKRLAAKPVKEPTPAKTVTVRLLQPKQIGALEKNISRLERVAERLAKTSEEVLKTAESAKVTGDGIRTALTINTVVPPSEAVRVVRTHSPAITRAPTERKSGDADDSARLNPGERAILTVIAQHRQGATSDQIAVIAGYKRSSRALYLQRLQKAGHVEKHGNHFIATTSGVDALGADFEPLPTGDALRRHWLGRLAPGEASILEELIEAYPSACSRATLGEAAGYKRSSRSLYVQRLAARQLIVHTERGMVRASEQLFG